MAEISIYTAADLPDNLYATCLANCLEKGHMRRDLKEAYLAHDEDLHVLVATSENLFCGWALVSCQGSGYPIAQFFVIPEFRRRKIASELLQSVLEKFGKVQCCPNADRASTTFFARFEKDIHLTALSRAWIEKYALGPVSFSTPCAIRYVY